MGWRGAMYAWESADTGAETCPEHAIGPDRHIVDILCGTQELHISADVAYAVWHYWEATGDDVFLRDAGAEILLETARFWSSRAQPEADGQHHIRGVIGPDEYHETIDDNAFTNVMARWNIRRGLDVAALLRQRWPERWASLSRAVGLDDAELRQWAGRRRHNGDRARSADGAVRAIRRVLQAGSHRLGGLRWTLRADGRGAWARADPDRAGHQAGRCRGAAGVAAG